ncbi:cation channel sperm-associated protein 4-like [Calonectris borealis]|uniref:cation channel sperm-associated protein 4-like n=1 Tax=Calonectris borealis TaxID=1323832 RepID=UPI003F4C9F90
MASLCRRCKQELDMKPRWLLIHFRDVVRSEDSWEHKEYMAKVWMSRLFAHPAVKLTLSVLIIINEVLIASQTPPTLPWSFQFWLSHIIDIVVLVALVTEVLLNWLRGFWLYWKDGWNIFNFLLMVYLMVGLLIPKLNVQKIFQILRVMRLLQICGPVNVLQAILKVIPDLCNVMFILFNSMLIFSVLGIILFGKSVPAHFGDLGKALYSLFSCIMLDGWLDIYKAFQEEGQTLKMMAAVYFIIFIVSQAFVCANLLVAVVTSSLWESFFTQAEEEQREQEPSLEESQDQAPRAGCLCGTCSPTAELGELSEEILLEVQHLLEGSKENIEEYKQIFEDLSVIIREVKAIEFNAAQEHELIQQKLFYTTFSDSPYPTEITLMMCGDITSTLSELEEADLVHPEDTWWVADGRNWGPVGGALSEPGAKSAHAEAL